jgi:transcriptional regulator with XRE-family HTH domain
MALAADLPCSAARVALTDKTRAYRLADVRTSMQIPQAGLAQQMGLTQGRISEIEKGEGPEGVSLATIRSYVEALGGRVEIVADFGDSKIRIA